MNMIEVMVLYAIIWEMTWLVCFEKKIKNKISWTVWKLHAESKPCVVEDFLLFLFFENKNVSNKYLLTSKQSQCYELLNN